MKNSTYIIAEIGINHNGDLEIAKKLIHDAAMAGCNAVKFQKRNPDVCVPEHQKDVMRSTPWGDMRYIDYKKKVEFGEAEYDEIDSYCKHIGIEWSVSIWDNDSLDFISKYDVPWIKIPSAMATNHDLIKKASETGKRLIISTGMCTQQEVDWIIDFCKDHASSGREPYVIMHTNSSYPSKLEDLNLGYIETLVKASESEDGFRFFSVGYSGHEFRLGTTVASVFLGAEYIERHITLDRTMWGTDHLSSVEPQGLVKLVSGVRELELSYGINKDHTKRILTDSELSVRKKLRG